jgi:hypothetical protein
LDAAIAGLIGTTVGNDMLQIGKHTRHLAATSR